METKKVILLLLTVLFNYTGLKSQSTSREVENSFLSKKQVFRYISLEVKKVRFINSFSISDYNTPEMKISYGYEFEINNVLKGVIGTSGGFLFGIPYDNRLDNTGEKTASNFDPNMLGLFNQIDQTDQELSKNRYFVEINPQINFRVLNRVQFYAGLDIRYYFDDFFDKEYPVIYPGKHFDYIGRTGVSFNFREYLLFGLNYNRAFGYLQNEIVITNKGVYDNRLKYESINLNMCIRL
jgi:hypothetical protein